MELALLWGAFMAGCIVGACALPITAIVVVWYAERRM